MKCSPYFLQVTFSAVFVVAFPMFLASCGSVEVGLGEGEQNLSAQACTSDTDCASGQTCADGVCALDGIGSAIVAGSASPRDGDEGRARPTDGVDPQDTARPFTDSAGPLEDTVSGCE